MLVVLLCGFASHLWGIHKTSKRWGRTSVISCHLSRNIPWDVDVLILSPSTVLRLPWCLLIGSVIVPEPQPSSPGQNLLLSHCKAFWELPATSPLIPFSSTWGRCPSPIPSGISRKFSVTLPFTYAATSSSLRSLSPGALGDTISPRASDGNKGLHPQTHLKVLLFSSLSSAYG